LISKVAIVGFGSAGRRALQEVRSLSPASEFLVLTRQEISEPGVLMTANQEQLVAFAPDLVVVANPASHRTETLRNLVETGASFFIEKPLAHSLDDALEVVTLLEEAKVRSQIGYNLRFSPSLVQFRHMIRESALGRVLSVRAETGQYLPDWRPSRDYRETVSAQAGLGGGVLLELSHEIDYLRWIFGPITWTSAWTGKTSNLDITVEDTAILSLGIESESAPGDLVASLALDFVRRDRTRSITAICEKGTMKWDGVYGRTSRWVEGSKDWEVVASDPEGESSYRTQWESFLAYLTGPTTEQTAGASVQDSLEVMKVVEAARLSHVNSGSRVEIHDVRGAP